MKKILMLVVLFVCFFVSFSVRKISYEYSSLENDRMNMKFDMMKENDSPECRKKSGRDISRNQVTVTY